MGFLRTAFLTLFCLQLVYSPALANDYEIVDIGPGNTEDVYFQINLGGTLYLNIQDKNGQACVDLWWIVWPFGTIKDVGRRCGVTRLDIPGVLDWSISSKLRARAGNELTKIGYSADERVANSITFNFP